jgi:hypothetical protein
MTSKPRSPLLTGSTISLVTGRLSKLSINTLMSSLNSKATTLNNKVKLKNNVYIKFFHRERAKLRAYLIQVNLVYILNPVKYNSDVNKVLIIVTYLRRDA